MGLRHRPRLDRSSCDRPGVERAPGLTTARGALAWALATLRLGTAADRLRADGSVGLEALDNLARDPLPEERLDLAEEPLLVDADQRDRVAGGPGAARPADPVDV